MAGLMCLVAGVAQGRLGCFLGRVDGLLILDSGLPRDPNQKLPVPLMAKPRAGTNSLLLYSVGQSKSQGRPRFKGRGIRHPPPPDRKSMCTRVW